MSGLENKFPKYKTIKIAKKNGGERIIFIPDEFTLGVQKKILAELKKLGLEISDCATAFQKGKSILDNAEAHLGNAYLIHYDLRDFFDTIFSGKVKEELLKRNLSADSVKLILKWCLFKGHLPQGAPTSPFLSNLVCANLDKRFSALAEKIGATYTRYADDIIISGNENILRHQTIFKRIIRTEKFFINHHKTWISVLDSAATRQEYLDANFFVPHHIITGLAVDGDKVFIRPSYLNKLWREIKNAEEITPHIAGKISFVNFVDADEGRKLYDYMGRFDG